MVNLFLFSFTFFFPWFWLKCSVYFNSSRVNVAKNNYGAVLSLWAPVILVGLQLFLALMSTYAMYAGEYINVSLSRYPIVYIDCAGLFYGYSNLVCSALNHIWWFCWSLWSPWRGNLMKPFCMLIFSFIFFFKLWTS